MSANLIDKRNQISGRIDSLLHIIDLPITIESKEEILHIINECTATVHAINAELRMHYYNRMVLNINK
jgi:hypothetical protein